MTSLVTFVRGQISRCNNLELLLADQNPIKDPPVHLFKRSLADILFYLAVRWLLCHESRSRASDLGSLSQDRAQGEEQCFRTRVVLLGDVGRLKLMKAITGKRANDADCVTSANVTVKIKHGMLPPGRPILIIHAYLKSVRGF